MMEYRTLGKSTLEISRIGFGCMSLDIIDPLSEQVLLDALAGGINFFDTADLYQQGENEALLGRTFKARRHQIVLATKVGNRWRPDGSGWDWNPSKKYILEAADQSLRRLKTDYIDLYQLHGGTMEDPIDEIIEAFEILKHNGKIRFYGISSIRPNVIREYVSRSSIISVMMQYSLLDRRPEESILPLLMEHQIGVLARGALAKGLLISKAANEYLNFSTAEISKLVSSFHSIPESKINPFVKAIQFVLSHTSIQAAIVGIRTASQLNDALSFPFNDYSNEEAINQLRKLFIADHYEQHR